MKQLKLSKKFHSILMDRPESRTIVMDTPDTVALLPSRVPFIKPKLLVREKDFVSMGTPLFRDKRDPRIQYLSPGAGQVIAVRLGSRRVIEEIVIRLDRDETMDENLCKVISEAHLPLDMDGGAAGPLEGQGSKALNELSILRVVEILMHTGMWQMIRQFPFMDIAPLPLSVGKKNLNCDAEKQPCDVEKQAAASVGGLGHSLLFPMIIVSLQPGDMFSPAADVILKGRDDDFLWGLAIMKKFASTVVVSVPGDQLEHVEKIKPHITHVTESIYPAGDPGVILHQIKTHASQNRSATIDPQDLMAMGALFRRGVYDLNRIHTIGGDSSITPCHLRARLGSPVGFLTGKLARGRGIVAGGVFNGRQALPKSHMGAGEYSVVVLDSSVTDRFFGFMLPGMNLMSESGTFLSGFTGGAVHADMNLHGEERACINCGLCDKKCPVDLLPQFIMKAARAGEMEEVIGMGLLDCALCGLCSCVCPSKIDLMQVMGLTKEIYYRERLA